MTQQIISYASRIFDVVGCSRRLSKFDRLLIIGLESTPERNLDEFGCLEGLFQMYGFGKHVSPRLESVLNFIHGNGFCAEAVGQYGYPCGRTINLKEEAIRAGLGKRGKSTLVLHPKYGPRLRFAAIRTDAPLEPTMDSILAEEESQLCNGCSICIDACPVKALEPYRMPDTSLCLSNISVMAEEHGRLILCDKCLHMCPAGKK